MNQLNAPLKTMEITQFQKLLPRFNLNRQFYLIVKNKKPLFHLIPALTREENLKKMRQELNKTNLYTAAFINRMVKSEKDILNNNLTTVNSLKKLTT